jgi:type I restriction enzyme R subunit
MSSVEGVTADEAVTRRLVDARLRAAGWTVTRYASQPWPAYAAVEECPTPTGPADYALCMDGQPLATVEAKRAMRDAYSALAQARRYAEGLETPFLYTANGDEIWFQDVRPEGGVPRAVPGFHSPDALLEMRARDPAALKDALRATPCATRASHDAGEVTAAAGIAAGCCILGGVATPRFGGKCANATQDNSTKPDHS